jgi:hypothetical protein
MKRASRIIARMTNDAVKLQRLRDVCAAFDRHDLDAIMEHFVDDCVFEWPRGPEPYGHRVATTAPHARARSLDADGHDAC